MERKWKCSDPECGAEWAGRPEDGFPHPPMPDDSPCWVCGAYAGDHDPGCMVGSASVSSLALGLWIVGALYLASHVGAWLLKMAEGVTP